MRGVSPAWTVPFASRSQPDRRATSQYSVCSIQPSPAPTEHAQAPACRSPRSAFPIAGSRRTEPGAPRPKEKIQVAGLAIPCSESTSLAIVNLSNPSGRRVGGVVRPVSLRKVPQTAVAVPPAYRYGGSNLVIERDQCSITVIDARRAHPIGRAATDFPPRSLRGVRPSPRLSPADWLAAGGEAGANAARVLIDTTDEVDRTSSL